MKIYYDKWRDVKILNEDYYKKFLIFLPAEAKYFLSEAKQITSNLPFFQKIILPESMLLFWAWLEPIRAQKNLHSCSLLLWYAYIVLIMWAQTGFEPWICTTLLLIYLVPLPMLSSSDICRNFNFLFVCKLYYLIIATTRWLGNHCKFSS